MPEQIPPSIAVELKDVLEILRNTPLSDHQGFALARSSPKRERSWRAGFSACS
jgi:hypothetical protein